MSSGPPSRTTQANPKHRRFEACIATKGGLQSQRVRNTTAGVHRALGYRVGDLEPPLLILGTVSYFTLPRQPPQYMETLEPPT